MPLPAEHVEPLASACRFSERAEESALAGTDLRVLVIDDDPDCADSLSMLLEGLGCRSIVTTNGPDALAIAWDFQPQLAIIDFEMPGMKGLETGRHLRLQGLDSLVMLVCLTGHDGALHRTQASEAGFDRVISKPISPSVLADVLQKARSVGRSGPVP